MSLIEIVVAIIVVGLITAYISYVIGFFSIVPTSLITLMMFAIALNVVLFIIHRK